MTKIEWTQSDDGTAGKTWNPVTGCSKVSPGCAHCYAETLSHRFGTTSLPWLPEHAAENVVLHPERLDAPLHWRKPKRVFVNSMSDLFHEWVPWPFIARVFATMALTPQHSYQVLTKRADRMKYIVESPTFVNEVACLAPAMIEDGVFPWPLPNVWLGVSVENQHFADERVPLLLEGRRQGDRSRECAPRASERGRSGAGGARAMNAHRCRRHLWIDESCALCGTGDQHRHCYEDRHACAWYEPLEHDAPRRPKR